MKWKKKGLIYQPNRISWQKKSTMLPTPILLGSVLRIYVGFCDENNVGRIGYVDVNPENPKEIYKVSNKPVLDIGVPGAFDDNGVVPISVLRIDGQILLYYIGFQLGVKVPYYMFCGLAISKDGEHFERYSQTPILDRSENELYARCGVNVIFDNNKYRMYYIGSIGAGWTMSQAGLKPLYTMMYLESNDGIHWDGEPQQCLEFQSQDEHGFGRPYVWKEDGIYKMLYSIRTYSRGYYIGYAESGDEKNWLRKDSEAGIDLSKGDTWDSKNLSYPSRFEYGEKVYLFYNGNGCGKTGFGYAELIKG